MSGGNGSDVRPGLVVRASKDGEPFWEAKWFVDGRQYKRRVGKAWLQRSGDEWVPRQGRAKEPYLDETMATGKAYDAITAVREAQEQAEQEAQALADAPLIFRELSALWLTWQGARSKPSTIRDYSALLHEPGRKYARGPRKSEGRIMAWFGDQDVQAITAKNVNDFLKSLEGGDKPLTPRNVNKHRQVVIGVLGYATMVDEWDEPPLAHNVAKDTKPRREPPPAALDYYETHEVELLVLAIADGKHRGEQLDHLTMEERMMRAQDDARDADFFRVLFYTGMRVSELRALRWRNIILEERVAILRRNVSAGVEVDLPKGGRIRAVPLSTLAVDVLKRQQGREDFTGDDDYVFVGRRGEMLDDSALRRRYKAGRDAIGLRAVKLHGLRHAAGSLFARHATPVEVRDFMGHAKMSTTDRYISAKASQEMLDRLDASQVVKEKTKR